MDRFQYLTKTLSRTIRKDKENYVVNAIYNRIGDNRIVPVSQQYINNPNVERGYYFIDLYFPQFNIGIECDEGYHKSCAEKDKVREATIIDVLKKIDHTSTYEAIHIDVSNEKTFEQIEERINYAVRKIKDRISQADAQGKLLNWDQVFPNNAEMIKRIKEKGVLLVSDNVSFDTIVAIDNQIFGKHTSNQQHSCYRIVQNQDVVLKAWFPKLTVDGNAVSRGWVNELSPDGKTIKEHNVYNYNAEKNESSSNKEHRVTFARTTDPITGFKAYRFVGIFAQDRIENGKAIYKRICDSFELPKKL